MKNAVILLFLILLPACYIISQTDGEIAKEKGLEAIKLMDKGQIDQSLKLLEEAQKLDPDNYIYPYEMAYANYLKEDYETAADILKKLEKRKDINDLVFQLLGNSYDELGKSKEAIKTYEKGLKKFPASGKLYLELGILYMRKENYNKALDYFEKGISAEPTFPSNYYWASKLFCSSEEEVWGMLYGEIFMNLERNSKRTAEISKLLFDTYKAEIRIIGDSATSVSFSQLNVVGFDQKKKLSLPYGMSVYEPTLMMSALGIKEINLGSLNKIRSNFIDIYYKNEYNKLFPNLLFDYQMRLKKLGHLEAYNYWVLMQGDQSEFITWQQVNEEKWKTFIEWFTKNPLNITFENCFDRINY
jgi:tetratricopeptide (TPR) repeat protein